MLEDKLIAKRYPYLELNEELRLINNGGEMVGHFRG